MISFSSGLLCTTFPIHLAGMAFCDLKFYSTGYKNLKKYLDDKY